MRKIASYREIDWLLCRRKIYYQDKNKANNIFREMTMSFNKSNFNKIEMIQYKFKLCCCRVYLVSKSSVIYYIMLHNELYEITYNEFSNFKIIF